jgi:multidrug resistance protein, MATE family
MGLQAVLEVGAFTLLGMMVATWGDEEAGAHQITLRVMMLAALPSAGTSDAACVLAGQAVGARRDDIVVGIARIAATMVVAYSIFGVVVIELAALATARLFADDAHLAATTTLLLRLGGIFLLVDGVSLIARGILRGAGDVRLPALVGIMTSRVVTPPLAWGLGAVLRLGAAGGWIRVIFETAVAAAVLWIRLARGSWREPAARTGRETEAADAADKPSSS